LSIVVLYAIFDIYQIVGNNAMLNVNHY